MRNSLSKLREKQKFPLFSGWQCSLSEAQFVFNKFGAEGAITVDNSGAIRSWETNTVSSLPLLFLALGRSDCFAKNRGISLYSRARGTFYYMFRVFEVFNIVTKERSCNRR